MADIKQLKEKNIGIYPVTVGEAVIFKDNTDAEIEEREMDDIFKWNRNYINLIETESDNYMIAEYICYKDDD